MWAYCKRRLCEIFAWCEVGPSCGTKHTLTVFIFSWAIRDSIVDQVSYCTQKGSIRGYRYPGVSIAALGSSITCVLDGPWLHPQVPNKKFQCMLDDVGSFLLAVNCSQSVLGPSWGYLGHPRPPSWIKIPILIHLVPQDQ